MSHVLASMAPDDVAAKAAVEVGLASGVLLCPAVLSADVLYSALNATLSQGGHLAHLAACAGAARDECPDGALGLLRQAGVGPTLAMNVLRSHARKLECEEDIEAAVAWSLDHAGAAMAALPLLDETMVGKILDSHQVRRSGLRAVTQTLAALSAEERSSETTTRAQAARRAAEGRRERLRRNAERGVKLREQPWSATPSLHMASVAADIAVQITDPSDPSLTARRWGSALVLVDSYSGTTRSFLAGLAALER